MENNKEFQTNNKRHPYSPPAIEQEETFVTYTLACLAPPPSPACQAGQALTS